MPEQDASQRRTRSLEWRKQAQQLRRKPDWLQSTLGFWNGKGGLPVLVWEVGRGWAAAGRRVGDKAWP